MVVYLIKNNTNGKCYVGQTTSKSPSRRWSSHCRLRKNATNQTPISLAIQKYGKHNFSFMALAAAATQQEHI
jgi:group I intron endonuclease